MPSWRRSRAASDSPKDRSGIRSGFLYVSDEEKNKLSRVYPDGRVETLLEIGDPDGSTLDAKGRLVTTASVMRAIIQVDPDGKYKVLADKYEGKRFNSPNDIILGPDGALYFTDPTLDLVKGEKQELPYQGVFRLGADGSVRLLTKDLAQPNGLAFSPDGKRLYIDDTKQHEIRVYDVAREWRTEERKAVRQGRRPRRRSRRHARGYPGQCLGDRSGRHLGVGSRWPPYRHHPDAGVARQSELGRFRLSHAVHHGEDIGVSSKTKTRGFVPKP